MLFLNVLCFKVPCLGEGNSPNFSDVVGLESALMSAPWRVRASS